jgi:DNA-binding beta-propeller fold protein YncE
MLASRKTMLLSAIPMGALALSLLTTPSSASDEEAKTQGKFLPTGVQITPTAAPGSTLDYLNPGLSDFPKFIASGATSTAKSPDGKTLLVLVGGFNSLSDKKGNTIPKDSNEYIFVYDIAAGKPVRKQIIQVPNSFVGIVFDPTGQNFYVGGGPDDNVHSYSWSGTSWSETGKPIALGHKGIANGVTPTDIGPLTGGVDITQDGSTLLVANLENDSISFIDTKSQTVVSEFDLRPGKIDPAQTGKPGGEYPFWVTVKGNKTAYVSSSRDREIVVIDFTTVTAPTVVSRIAVAGNPNKMIFDKAQKFLYVAEDNSDLVDVIDTSSNTPAQSVAASAPARFEFDKALRYHGNAPNSLALSPDETTLYVTLGGTNALSVIQGVPYHPEVAGLIPTGFVPNAVALSADGKYVYVANGKDVTGPNPGLTYLNQQDPNQYVFDLQKSSLLSFAVPSAAALKDLTTQVARNDHFTAKLDAKDAALMQELHKRIKHVIYFVKENRTYDQVLGDLDRGNGDPALVDFGQQITPNYHALAQQFVDLDNFYCSADVSGDGHAWSFGGRENDLTQKSIPLNYSGRGTSYDTEGQNRDVNVGLATVKERQAYNPVNTSDPNILPGRADVGAMDGPEGSDPQTGYIWDAVTRAGLKFRNYGYHCDLFRYGGKNPIPLELNPASKNIRVAFPSRETLLATTDPYFRAFDNRFPDFYREKEWEREFDNYVKKGDLPALMLVRMMHDHMGNFGNAIKGVNTPEVQQADNDYAVALLIEKVAHSPYKDSTLICILEDDSQDGADHIDSHRSTGFIVGPYVKHGAVVSQKYTTVNMLRTIEDVLGLDHIAVLTASESPMTEVFDLSQKEWSFDATPSIYLYNTQLPLPGRFAKGRHIPKSTHDAAYWTEKTKGFDFTQEDHLGDPEKFNRIIWEGLHGNTPYPSVRSGLDLRKNRQELLRKAGVTPNRSGLASTEAPVSAQ